jgi:DUF1365 family protein
MDMDVSYGFRVTGPDERIAVGIRACSPEGPVIDAVLAGTRRALTDRELLRVGLAIPALTLKVMAAIHWEALRLWLKGSRYRRRPAAPAHAASVASVSFEHLD